MNRLLPWLNLGGVLALGLLCGVQWHQNWRLTLRRAELEQRAHLQSQSLADQAQRLDRAAADIAELRTAAESNSLARVQLDAAKAANHRLAAERDQLRTSLQRWTTALEERDHALESAHARIGELTRRLNETIGTPSELVTTPPPTHTPITTPIATQN